MGLISLDILPEKEKEIYNKLTLLSAEEKSVMYEIVGRVNKDGVSIFQGEYEIVRKLIRKGLITQFANGRFFVLTKAPYLLNQIAYYYRTRKQKPKLF